MILIYAVWSMAYKWHGNNHLKVNIVDDSDSAGVYIIMSACLSAVANLCL